MPCITLNSVTMRMMMVVVSSSSSVVLLQTSVTEVAERISSSQPLNVALTIIHTYTHTAASQFDRS